MPPTFTTLFMKVEALVAGVCGGLLLLLGIAIALVKGFWSNPRSFLQFPKTRDTLPPFLADGQWGRSEYIQANGIRFHYVTKGEGPLMLCLHGWPEFWFSWRQQLKEFSKDYKVVAIDMRGFNDTDKPKDSGAYNLPFLLSDIEGVIKALGYDSCVLLAHDWGAVIAWEFAHYKPQMIEKLVILSIPHPSALQPRDMFWLGHVFVFNIPFLPELIMSVGDYYILRLIYQKIGDKLKGSRLSPAEVEAYIYAISRPRALTSGMNYYRNMFFARVTTPMKAGYLSNPKVPVPTLLLQGQDDKLIPRRAFHDTIKHCKDCTLIFVPDCDHWILQEQPQVVNQHVRNFLKKSS
eukprot:comp21263_c0_seq1/m.28990 comp21263_c0_seq1/g.28990  ORF comp21263_c0_seq1/g.28990 comp21263_c0_seq1/m.28990 type:complete len:349 (-) comp21263_c0_seq1:158-1204(-)